MAIFGKILNYHTTGCDDGKSMRVLVCTALILFIGLLSVASSAEENKTIVINDLSSQVKEGYISVNGEVEYHLDERVKEALNNGIEMTFRLEIELMQQRAYWLDITRSKLRYEFKVKYHALSKQYVMRAAGSDAEQSFSDLYSAFYYQRRIHDARVASTELLHAEKKYYLRARARLVSEKLPIPLRIKSYLSSGWRPSSGWSVWPV